MPLYELADWWGNPLIYIHNRDYALTDGVTPGWSNVNYTGAKPDNQSIQALSRSNYGFKSGTPPNLDSYQLYSLGTNGVGNLMQTGANTYAVPAPGQLPWNNANPWTLQQMHFLANWEE